MRRVLLTHALFDFVLPPPRQQVAHHRIGEQPASHGEHETTVVDVPQSPSNSVLSSSTPGAVQHVQGQSVAQTHLEEHPLDPTGVGVEHLAAVGVARVARLLRQQVAERRRAGAHGADDDERRHAGASISRLLRREPRRDRAAGGRRHGRRSVTGAPVQSPGQGRVTADDEDNLRRLIALLETRGGGLESSESGVGRLLHPEDYSESEDYEDEDSDDASGDTTVR